VLKEGEKSMARKRTQNYRELRADFDEEEQRPDDEESDEEGDEDEEEDDDEEEAAPSPGAEGEAGGEEGEEGDDEDAPKKKKPKAKPKPKPKRTRVAKVTRMRLTWGVFNNSNQMVKDFDYPQKAEAEAHAAKLMAEKKSTHFVQPVKVAIEEKKEEKKEK
jgi:hypothetical protein